MTENTESFKVSSLDGKGALWTIAGTAIAGAATGAINTVAKLVSGRDGGGGGGGCHCGDGGAGAVLAANAMNNAYGIELAKKNSEIALLKADKYTDQKLVEVYKDLRGIDKEQSAVIGNLASRVAAIETAAPLREQILCGKIGEVATMASNGINCLSAQLTSLAATVAGITKNVVPITAVCPQPMPQYNAWVAPTGPTA
jgi:hypothetical protein